MEFRSEIKATEFLDPLHDFKRAKRYIEYRFDPLTGYLSRINVDRIKRVKQTHDRAIDIADAASQTSTKCYFCRGNMAKETTKFVPGVLSEHADGRITVGQCKMFPNLYPFAEHHAVGTLTDQHYLELNEFTSQMIEDNLKATLEYIGAVHRLDAGARYPIWMWNYLPPSGASIVHPHVQVAMEHAPVPELASLLTKSGDYLRDTGVNFWHELITVEKGKRERFIGENASVAVVAAFSPRGNRDIQIISKRVGNISDFDEKHTRDFADAVVRVLRGYKAMGINSFNLVTYSAAIGDRPEHFRFSARMISRPVFQPLYTNDSGPVERFYGLSIIESMPEQVASEIRKCFDS